MQTSTASVESYRHEAPHLSPRNIRPPAIRFPQSDFGDAQDSEWCEVYLEARWERLRLHDYDRIYSIPGLYEHLFGDLLQCVSPQRVVGLLSEVLQERGHSPTMLNVLDLGAGNGMVGRELRGIGVRELVGVDVIPEAAAAARRDRPSLYDDYLVEDLCKTDLVQMQRESLARLNTLVCVAALGFGDIPVPAFACALRAISTPGWLAFNIKESFLSGDDESGFCRFIRALSDNGIIRIEAYRRYPHRLSISGKRLFYVAVVARKLRDVPDELVRANDDRVQ